MPGHDVTAIILAAGVARRLAPLTDRTQKSLLPVGGRPILAWMMAALHAVGVPRVVIVVGHCADQVTALSASAPPGMVVQFIDNPAYRLGLVGSAAPNALLVDGGFADTGEEVKVYTKSDRVIALGKKVVPEAWDRVGEGIGFFKCGAGAGPELVRLLEQVIEESHQLCEYEDALHLLVSRQHVQPVDVTGLPWTEVDFVEDLRRAQAEVFPAIARLEGP